MISLTRKTDYALIALVSLAESGAPRSARALSEDLSVSNPVMRNILKDLTRAGLLDSTQGAGGGYALSREPERLTVADVVEAIEGGARLTLCCGEGAPESERCRLEPSCRIKAVVRIVNDRLDEFLHTITIADLLTGAVPRLAGGSAKTMSIPAGAHGARASLAVSASPVAQKTE